MSDPDHHAMMEEHVSYGLRIQELEADIERLCGMLEIEHRASAELRAEIERLHIAMQALADGEVTSKSFAAEEFAALKRDHERRAKK